MTATTCERCGATPMPTLGPCVDCRLAASSSLPPPALRRFRVLGPLRDPVRLAAALARLSPGVSQAEVDWLLSQAVFDVCAELRGEEEARLRALIAECAARFFVETGGAPPTVLRFGVDVRTGTKVAATLAIGGATLAFGVPWVPVAAAGMLALLACRGVRHVPLEIVVTGASAAELLGVVASSVVDEARAARTAATDDGALDAFRACFGALLALSATVRAGAAHLTQPERARADAALTRLGRPLARLAGRTARGVAPYRVDPADDAPARQLARIALDLASTREALATSDDAVAAQAALERVLESATRGLDAGAPG